ncbi:hypothetical protein [Klebsiella oxytoca]|uniref:hypothetical protein n=1 Tax=Klebsiella oxytoca TaxID=571 RepID=UPI0039C9C249
MKQQYRVSAVLASTQGTSAEVPRDIMAVLKREICSLPFAPEIVKALNELGYDARREQEPCPANQVGVWVTIGIWPVLLQCELESLTLH